MSPNSTDPDTAIPEETSQAADTNPEESEPHLAPLACGASCSAGAYQSIYSHLFSTLADLERLAFSLKDSSFDSDLASFAAPLVARSIFETALTALIGRFDPLRILIVRESQLADDYDFSKKNDLAINWQNDFHGEALRPASGGQEPKLKIDSMPRALLGKYYERSLWLEAVERLSDSARTSEQGEWLRQLLRFQPTEFIPRMRTEIQSVYSSCSKGIHQEFVVRQSEYSTRENLRLQVGQALELTSKLAAAFNCSPHVLYPIEPSRAIAHINSLDRKWAE
jgi:hypothetical protein